VSLYTKREPWPFHVKIDGVGFMLGSGRQSTPALVSAKMQDITAVAPPDYSYAGTNPTSEREEPYESLHLGMGLDLQEEWQDQRYLSASAVDCSVWPWVKGPEVVQFTPGTRDTTNGIREFFEIGSTLFCANGQYILRRDTDGSWPVAKDFGAGWAVRDVSVFTSNFDGVQRAFVGFGPGHKAQYTTDGTTWTEMATFEALAFAIVGQEFYWAQNVNQMRKLDVNSNPTIEGNYTSLIFNVGDKSAEITSLMVSAAGVLIVAKTDGLYTLKEDGLDRALFPFLRYADTPRNGRTWGQFENSLYVSYGHSFGRIDNDLSWTPIGPEKLVDNTSPVRGFITAFAGVETMFGMAAIYDGDTGLGHLLKLGAWSSEPDGTTKHIDAWHGSLCPPFVNRTVQSMFVSSIGATAGHTRVYLGFSDGGVGWLLNPCTPNPTACGDYRYHVGDGWVDLPVWHGQFHASEKSIRHISVVGQHLGVANWVTVDTDLNPTEPRTWTDVGTRFDVEPIEQAGLAVTSTCVLAAFRVHLHNVVATDTPRVSAVSIGHALRPARLMQFTCDILCADGLIRRDGVPIRMGRQQIRTLIEAAVDNPGAVRCILPDESTQDLSFTDLEIRQSFDEVGRQWRGSLRIKAVQWEAT
jgi:hypothetical protein